MTQHCAHRSAHPAIAVMACDQGNPARVIVARDTRRRPAFERPFADRKVALNHGLVGRGLRQGDPLEAIVGVEDTKLRWGDLQAVRRLAVTRVQTLRLWDPEVELGLQSALTRMADFALHQAEAGIRAPPVVR